MLSFFCKQKISEELERRLSHGLKVFAAAAVVVVDAVVVVVVDAAIAVVVVAAIVVVVAAAVVAVAAVVADDLWIIFCLCGVSRVGSPRGMIRLMICLMRRNQLRGNFAAKMTLVKGGAKNLV